jgi:ATP-dependent HslUV protease ATP-binding subunit HslU
VGKDVESMIRELPELSVKMVREEEQQRVQVRAQEIAEERLLNILMGTANRRRSPMESILGGMGGMGDVDTPEPEPESDTEQDVNRQKLKDLLRAGKLEDRSVDLEISAQAMPMVEVISSAGLEEMGFNLKEMFGNLMPKQKKKRKVRVPEALKLLTQEEMGRLIDMENVTKDAVQRVEQNGIVFLDEIDKIAGREGAGQGPDVSREGVQRDILPIVEGSTVSTKYGMVRTDHILFIAAGAFHVSKPSDLIPELQGRFPIRVELQALTKEDFLRILIEPQNSLTRQYIELLKTEGVTIEFSPDALEELAGYAATVNEHTENIGARRLHTIMEKVLEEVSFHAPEMGGQKVAIDAKYVQEKLANLVKDVDLSRYIL